MDTSSLPPPLKKSQTNVTFGTPDFLSAGTWEKKWNRLIWLKRLICSHYWERGTSLNHFESKSLNSSRNCCVIGAPTILFFICVVHYCAWQSIVDLFFSLFIPPLFFSVFYSFLCIFCILCWSLILFFIFDSFSAPIYSFSL